MKLQLLGTTTLLLLLIGCGATEKPSQVKNTNEAPPFWLSDLSNKLSGNSVYGVAKTISVSHLPPLHFAKKNAIKNWSLANNITLPDIDGNLAEQQTFQLADSMLYFLDSFEQGSNLYVLVSNKKQTIAPVRSTFPICEIQQCQPDWLCKGRKNELSIVNVSAQTGHPNDPIVHVIENSQNIAKLVNKSFVKGSVRTLNARDNFQEINGFQQSYNILRLENLSSTVKIRSMCMFGSNLVSRVTLAESFLPAKENWMTEPNLGNTTGVVGQAEGFSATGRISDLIEIAAKKGLFELAKAKNIKIDGRLTMRQSSDGGFSLVRISHQSTESIVSAYVADMKVELNRNYQPIINIWLLDKKE